MDVFGQRLKERAGQLGISNSAAARLCGLDERRYGHYVTGRTEPDLATLVRIARTLGTTPNWLLGVSSEDEPATPRSDYLDRLTFVAKALPDRELALLVTLAEALARHAGEAGNADGEGGPQSINDEFPL